MSADTTLILRCPPETSTLVTYPLARSWRKKDPEIHVEPECNCKRGDSASIPEVGKKSSGSRAWRSSRKEDATKT